MGGMPQIPEAPAMPDIMQRLKGGIQPTQAPQDADSLIARMRMQSPETF
jgi:hypothetical protein